MLRVRWSNCRLWILRFYSVGNSVRKLQFFGDLFIDDERVGVIQTHASIQLVEANAEITPTLYSLIEGLIPQRRWDQFETSRGFKSVVKVQIVSPGFCPIF